MRLPITSLAILALAASCASAPPASERPALGLPVSLSAEGWAALEAADPIGAAALDAVNARWLCGYARAALTAEEQAGICGDG